MPTTKKTLTTDTRIQLSNSLLSSNLHPLTRQILTANRRPIRLKFKRTDRGIGREEENTIVITPIGNKWNRPTGIQLTISRDWESTNNSFQRDINELMTATDRAIRLGVNSRSTYEGLSLHGINVRLTRENNSLRVQATFSGQGSGSSAVTEDLPIESVSIENNPLQGIPSTAEIYDTDSIPIRSSKLKEALRKSLDRRNRAVFDGLVNPLTSGHGATNEDIVSIAQLQGEVDRLSAAIKGLEIDINNNGVNDPLEDD